MKYLPISHCCASAGKVLSVEEGLWGEEKINRGLYRIKLSAIANKFPA